MLYRHQIKFTLLFPTHTPPTALLLIHTGGTQLQEMGIVFIITVSVSISFMAYKTEWNRKTAAMHIIIF